MRQCSSTPKPKEPSLSDLLQVITSVQDAVSKLPNTMSGAEAASKLEKAVCLLTTSGGNATGFFFEDSNGATYLVSNLHVLWSLFKKKKLELNRPSLTSTINPDTIFVTPSTEQFLNDLTKKHKPSTKAFESKIKTFIGTSVAEDVAMIPLPLPLGCEALAMRSTFIEPHFGAKLWGLARRPIIHPQKNEVQFWAMTGTVMSKSSAMLKLNANGTLGFSGTPLVDVEGYLIAIHRGSADFPHMAPEEAKGAKAAEGTKTPKKVVIQKHPKEKALKKNVIRIRAPLVPTSLMACTPW